MMPPPSFINGLATLFRIQPLRSCTFPFVRRHSPTNRQAIAAMDFFPVPTLTFGVLYRFFIIGHDRRRILRFNVT